MKKRKFRALTNGDIFDKEILRQSLSEPKTESTS